MRLKFREIYLFAPSEKKAKRIEFIDGINVITSSQEDGTDRGKSVLMRSLYHTMGAEGCFDKNWATKDKVYVLKIDIEGVEYYLYRSADLFKFFSDKKEVLFTSVSSKELSKKLREYTYFAVRLPNRDEKLEITPPAYNYLPFYLDQDHYTGNHYTIHMRSKHYNLIEDAILIKNDLQLSLLEYQKQVEKEEKVYKELLEQMDAYEEKIKINNKQADDVLRQKGLSELRDDVVSDKIDIAQKIEQEEEELKKVTAAIKTYSEKKKNIEKKYYEYMMEARTKFGLNELSPESFKKLTGSVDASGSNKNIATIVWYIAILELRKLFNKEAIEFPVVFDSPNNVETDNVKRYGLIQYVSDKCSSGQLILSLLGFEKKDIETEQPINVITLTNEKYKLLDSESYEKYKDLLETLCDA